MTKRLISLVLALLMVLSVVASASTDAEPEEKPEWKIAVVPKMTTIAWFERMEKGVEMYNEEFESQS